MYMYMYLNLCVWNGVLSQARPVKGHPVLVVVEVHCLNPPSVEPTLLLSVQPSCSRGDMGRGGYTHTYMYTAVYTLYICIYNMCYTCTAYLIIIS